MELLGKKGRVHWARLKPARQTNTIDLAQGQERCRLSVPWEVNCGVRRLMMQRQFGRLCARHTQSGYRSWAANLGR